jgi:hypothetical protein
MSVLWRPGLLCNTPQNLAVRNPTFGAHTLLESTRELSKTLAKQIFKELHRGLTQLFLLTGLAAALSAAKVEGVLMDKMCSMKVVKEGQKAATMHTRQSAMMPDCEKSGYGVFTVDNKYLVFDAAGNEQAIAALKSYKKKDNLKVKVSGEVDGETIKVASLKLQ